MNQTFHIWCTDNFNLGETHINYSYLGTPSVPKLNLNPLNFINRKACRHENM